MVGFVGQTTGCVLRALTIRQRLRAGVWEMTGGMCEWPACHHRATEMAHIHPRGMGHTGYRDTFDNVMAACSLHARVTDDGSHDAWSDIHGGYPGTMYGARVMLADHVARSRARNGYNVAAMQTELDAQ